MPALHDIFPLPEERIIPAVAGLPVTGHIQLADPLPAQRTLTDLDQLITNTLAGDKDITALGWFQYSPYLGDLEWGRFRTDTPWVQTIHDLPDADYPGDEPWCWEIERTHPSIARPGPEADDTRHATYDPDRWARCTAFVAALYSCEYNDALLAAFGDCAAVTVTPGVGITVTEYIGTL
ncbi:hypothetical protein ABH935_007031 [Catenulispora sp. GAS73]|uniref:hypothetical protein n=1 Tax=Catenulispora sp. GAS73 TaxID=3156269 RepID=UPI0035163703